MNTKKHTKFTCERDIILLRAYLKENPGEDEAKWKKVLEDLASTDLSSVTVQGLKTRLNKLDIIYRAGDQKKMAAKAKSEEMEKERETLANHLTSLFKLQEEKKKFNSKDKDFEKAFREGVEKLKKKLEQEKEKLKKDELNLNSEMEKIQKTSMDLSSTLPQRVSATASVATPSKPEKKVSTEGVKEGPHIVVNHYYDANCSPAASVETRKGELTPESSKGVKGKQGKLTLKKAGQSPGDDQLSEAKKQKKDSRPMFGTKKCNSPNCMTCQHVIESADIKFPKKTWTATGRFTCNSSDTVYAVICKRCKMAYIGETAGRMSLRFGLHVKEVEAEASSAISYHFNQLGHEGAKDMEIAVFEADIEDDRIRFNRQNMLIRELGTLRPKGINEYDW